MQQSTEGQLAAHLARLLRDVNAPLQEWVTWHPVAELPERDVDVLVSWGDTGGVLLGAYLGVDRGWIGSDAMPLLPPPAYWAKMPIGPINSRIGAYVPQDIALKPFT